MCSYHGKFVFLALGIMKLVSGDNCLDVDSLVHSDKYMERQVFRKFWCQSLYICASECLMSSACLSFGFEKKTRTCLLNSNSSDTTNVVDRTGFLFSDIQHWPKSLSGPCTQRTCPNSNRCEVSRLGLARCVPDFQGCGHPPNVRDANATYNGHYQGAVTKYSRYSCDPDFRACYNTVTSTCQSSGAWESLPGLCEQFRWYNLQINDRYSFPCVPSSKFKLKIRGTPTKNTRWSIGIHKQADVVLYIEFRLSSSTIGLVVFNTNIDTKWGTEVRANLKMAVWENYGVEITLQDGVYRVVVDGASIINFPERVSGAEPDGVSVFRDVTIGMMEFMSSLNNSRSP